MPPQSNPSAKLTDAARLRAAARAATDRGFTAGFPNFHFSSAHGGVSGHVFLPASVVEWRDVRVADLQVANPFNLRELFISAYWYAVRDGYPAAFPNGHQATHPGTGQVCGINLIKPGQAVIHKVRLTDLGGPAYVSIPAMFRAVANYATANGFGGGFPTFAMTRVGRVSEHHVVLFPAGSVTWADVPLSEITA
ncbi:MAG: hypothetical protein JNK19_00150 [Tabrizicola sp.]|nr:hypothetical protein [Tabrizicola sp.]